MLLGGNLRDRPWLVIFWDFTPLPRFRGGATRGAPLGHRLCPVAQKGSLTQQRRSGF
jgi:hypothetical protein